MGIKLTRFLIFILLVSCISNSGEYYSVRTKTKSHIFDLTTPADYTFNAGEIQVVSDTASLISSAISFDDFDDNVTTNWSSSLITATSSAFTEENQMMSGDCNAGTAALIPIINLATDDYVLYLETTPTTFDSTPSLSTLFRYADISNHFKVTSIAGQHTIDVVSGGVTTNVATVADASFTLTTGITYATRISVNGITLEYKIWIPATEPEPAAYQVTGTNALNTTGGFALECNQSEVIFNNVEELPAGGTNNTVLGASTLTFPVMPTDGTMTFISKFELTGTLLDENELLFDISFDGGTTFLTYANFWRENTSSENGAMTLTQLNDKIRDLSPPSNTPIIRAYFYSADGWANPQVTTLKITYDVFQ
jgi:hypothetical protein